MRKYVEIRLQNSMEAQLELCWKNFAENDNFKETIVKIQPVKHTVEQKNDKIFSLNDVNKDYS